jgi:carotenoid cleavage dioxygenase
VLVLVYDQTRNASRFDVLDARAITDDPSRRPWLPHRVPYGFHGNWVRA